jgi:hypothetical protein
MKLYSVAVRTINTINNIPTSQIHAAYQIAVSEQEAVGHTIKRLLSDGKSPSFAISDIVAIEVREEIIRQVLNS